MEYLIPGVGFVAEDDQTRELLLPGGGFLAEQTVASQPLNLFTPWIEG